MRMKGLGVDEVHLGAHDKLQVLLDVANRLQFEMSEVAYMGDGLPDRLALQHAGLAVVRMMQHQKYVRRSIG